MAAQRECGDAKGLASDAEGLFRTCAEASRTMATVGFKASTRTMKRPISS
jgi:hypothetical protein